MCNTQIPMALTQFAPEQDEQTEETTQAKEERLKEERRQAEKVLQQLCAFATALADWTAESQKAEIEAKRAPPMPILDDYMKTDPQCCR